MSNSMSDDYFSFMSSKWEDKSNKQTTARRCAADGRLYGPRTPSTFVEESQIEVTESPLSDTMIQRVFKRFSAA